MTKPGTPSKKKAPQRVWDWRKEFGAFGYLPEGFNKETEPGRFYLFLVTFV